jgi:hypothetical protein
LQVAPLQQPFGQFCGVQPVQTPLVHTWSFGHAWHEEPPLPQSALVLPPWHWPFVSQQPCGHDDTLQTQVPFEQI